MSSYILRINYPNQKVRNVPLSRLVAVPAESGVSYELLDRATLKPISGVALKKSGENLVVEVDHQAVVHINRYYQSGQQAEFLHASANPNMVEASRPSESTYQTSQTELGKPAKGMDWSGWDMGGNWGNVLLGGAAVGGLLALASGSKKSDNSAQPASSSNNNTSTLSGVVMAGQIISGNDLKLQLLKADGSLLQEVKVGDDGKFSLTTSYTGVFFAKVSDSNAATPDYLDETSKENKDLNAELWSAGVIAANGSTLFINVNPLTTIAYNELKQQAGSSAISSTMVTQANQAVAKAFDVADLHLADVVLATNSNFAKAGSLSNTEKYGAVLAMLSGVDKTNNYNQQTTINNFNEHIVFDGSNATLDSTANQYLTSGSSEYLNASNSQKFLLITSAAAQTVEENLPTSSVVYQVLTTNGSATSGMQYQLSGTDATAFSISTNGELHFVNSPDFETKTSYNLIVTATQASLSAQKAVAINISNKVDETAPVIQSASKANDIEDGSGAGSVVYTVLASDTSAPIKYRLKADADSSMLSINESNGAVTLLGNSNYAFKNTYSFTVVATDAASNSSEQTVSFNVKPPAMPQVSDISITTVTGANNGYLNVGDEVSVQVQMNKATLVTGSPALTLTIGSTSVAASYSSSSSDNKTLTFKYTITAGQNDANGISVPVNALQLNGGSLKDSSGNAALLTNTAVTDNPLYKVDTTAPSDYFNTPLPLQLEALNKNNGNDLGPDIMPLGNTGALQLIWRGEDSSGKNSVFIQKINADGSAGSVQQLATTDVADAPKLTTLGDTGAWAAVWTAFVNNTYGLEVQKFNADGSTATTNPVRISVPYNPNIPPSPPQITAVGSAGKFAVAWMGIESAQNNADRVYVQIFNADGSTTNNAIVKLGVPNAKVDINQAPQLTGLADGSVLVTWEGSDAAGRSSIWLQKLDSTGSTVGSPQALKANGVANYAEHGPQIISLGNNGEFVVAWSGNDSSNKTSIYVQKFNAAGSAEGGQQRIGAKDATDDTGVQISEIGSNRAFVATWLGTNDNASKSVYVQRFNADGSVNGSMVQLPADNMAKLPSISKLGSDGTFVVGWQSRDELGKPAIFAQKFNADGTTTGNTLVKVDMPYDSTNNNTQPQLSAAGSNGEFALSWHALDRQIDSSIFVQKFNSNSTPVFIGNPLAKIGDTLKIHSSETGTAYLVHNSVNVSNLASITSAASDLWRSVQNDSTDFQLNSYGLASGVYKLYGVDQAGNLGVASANQLSLMAVDQINVSKTTGMQNQLLNTGDTLELTVALLSSATVDTSKGFPKLALTIGSSTQYANYLSGSGSKNLVFQYTVQAQDNDSDGLTIPTDALSLNGATLKDSNNHDLLLWSNYSKPLQVDANNKAYIIDNTAPIAKVLAPVTITSAGEVTMRSSDAGDAYLVNSNITISKLDDLVNAPDNQANKVSVMLPDFNTNIPATGLIKGDYKVYSVDKTGNVSSAASNSVTVTDKTAIVVFDLVNGVSSDHSSRQFDANTHYTIYIRSNSNNATLSHAGNGPGAADTWGTWHGANNLGADDKVILVGNAANMLGDKVGKINALSVKSAAVTWQTSKAGHAADLAKTGKFHRYTANAAGSEVLWTGAWASPDKGLAVAQVYFTNMPKGVLTSQGLA